MAGKGEALPFASTGVAPGASSILLDYTDKIRRMHGNQFCLLQRVDGGPNSMPATTSYRVDFATIRQAGYFRNDDVPRPPNWPSCAPRHTSKPMMTRQRRREVVFANIGLAIVQADSFGHPVRRNRLPLDKMPIDKAVALWDGWPNQSLSDDIVLVDPIQAY